MPLKTAASAEVFKVYLLDTGVLGAMVRLPQQFLVSQVELLAQFRGALFENVVASALNAQWESEIFYWTSKSQAEVDFVLEYQGKVIPIETKSGDNLRSKSLLSFIKRYDPPIAFRVSLRPLAKNGKVVDLPIYLLSEIGRLFERLV